MSKSPKVSDLIKISTELNLKFINENNLSMEESDIIPIVNLRDRTLKVINTTAFCSKYKKQQWATDVINAPPPDEKEKKSLAAAQEVWKALLETDKGLGVVVLTPAEKGQPVITYEGIHKAKEEKIENDYHLELRTNGKFDGTTIDGSSVTGWGPHMQSLPNDDELACYHFTAEIKKESVAKANILLLYLNKRVMGVAMTKLKPLDQIGFPYGPLYWAGLPENPAIFNKDDGFSIPKTAYQIQEYFFVFKDENFIDHTTNTKRISIEEIQTVLKSKKTSSFCIQGTIAYNPDDIKSLVQKDPTTGCYLPKRMFSLIKINCTAVELLSIAQSLIENPDSQMTDFQYVQFISKRLEQAEFLFIQQGQRDNAISCRQQRIQFYADAIKNGLFKGKGIDPEDLNSELRRAAAIGANDPVKLLLKLKAEINSSSKIAKKTALHYAAENNYFETCQMLIEAKADAGVKDAQQKIPLEYLKKSGSPLHKLLQSATPTKQSLPEPRR